MEAYLKGKNDISDELVFPSQEGTILDPDNLHRRVFLPVLAKAGIRKIRLHDPRHTFGLLLLQNSASIVYVKDQMGHSSIQVTGEANGRVAGILNPPEHGVISSLAFASKNLDWLYVAEGGKLFRRSVKVTGAAVGNPAKPPQPPL